MHEPESSTVVFGSSRHVACRAERPLMRPVEETAAALRFKHQQHSVFVALYQQSSITNREPKKKSCF